jgi:SMC interacting uncharacterized protein involved in chromosome segregation
VKHEEEAGLALDMDKPLPQPEAHVNDEIKGYLEHAKKDRLIIVKEGKQKAAKTRTATEIEQIKQKQEAELVAFEKYYKEKKDKDEAEKKAREEAKAKFQQGLANELQEAAVGFKTLLRNGGSIKRF